MKPSLQNQTGKTQRSQGTTRIEDDDSLALDGDNLFFGDHRGIALEYFLQSFLTSRPSGDLRKVQPDSGSKTYSELSHIFYHMCMSFGATCCLAVIS